MTNYQVIYSDGMCAMRRFKTERGAINFMNKTIASNKRLREITVYKAGRRFHSTTQTEYIIAKH